jgi:hypothetical protein
LTLRINQSLAKTAASVNYPSARLPRLTQIDAPFSSRLSRDTNAQLYAFEGKGHLPIFTATDEFCEVLRRFVRTGTATA